MGRRPLPNLASSPALVLAAALTVSLCAAGEGSGLSALPLVDAVAAEAGSQRQVLCALLQRAQATVRQWQADQDAGKVRVVLALAPGLAEDLPGVGSWRWSPVPAAADLPAPGAGDPWHLLDRPPPPAAL